MRRIMAVLGLVIALGSATAVVARLDARWAKASEVNMISERLERKILEDRLADLRERLWDLENHWLNRYWAERGREPETIEALVAYMDERDRDRWHWLTEKIKELEAKLRKLDEGSE